MRFKFFDVVFEIDCFLETEYRYISLNLGPGVPASCDCVTAIAILAALSVSLALAAFVELESVIRLGRIGLTGRRYFFKLGVVNGSESGGGLSPR